jgi:starvation-inducible outer membrane lipoprotein
MLEPQNQIELPQVNKNHISLGAGFLIFALSIASCTKPPPANARQDAAPAASAQAVDKAAPGASPNAQSFSGKVAETMNAANYTYVLVDTGTQKKWAAAPQFQVKAGDSISIEEGMPMPNYHSKALNRDFDVVYFTGRALVGGAQTSVAASAAILPQGHPPISSGTAQATKVDLSGIAKAEGGKTVAEIFAAKAQIAGKQVKVRGKVVKFNSMIMGKNWLHLQDGSGAEGSNDLTLTTLSDVKVGNTIVATGTIAIDKDFGYGYKYSVIMEDAKLVVE